MTGRTQRHAALGVEEPRRPATPDLLAPYRRIQETGEFASGARLKKD